MSEIRTSYSEIDAYRQCQLKHQLAYLERWKTPETPTRLALGSAFHKILSVHYGILRQDGGLAEAVAAVKLLLREGIGTQGAEALSDEDHEILVWMYTGYVTSYERDYDWKIVHVEEWIEHEMAPGVVLRSVLDLVVEWQGALWVVDHKTCGTLPAAKEIDIDDQLGLYTWAARQQGMPIKGAIWNHVRTKRNKKPMELDERFRRTLTYRTNTELDSMVREATMQMVEAYSHGEDGRGAEGQDRPRSPDPDRCRWRCDFLEPCLHGRKTDPARMREFLETSGYRRGGHVLR